MVRDLEGENGIYWVASDEKESFWESIPVSELSPEQRKHFKRIMRKEVRSK